MCWKLLYVPVPKVSLDNRYLGLRPLDVSTLLLSFYILAAQFGRDD